MSRNALLFGSQLQRRCCYSALRANRCGIVVCVPRNKEQNVRLSGKKYFILVINLHNFLTVRGVSKILQKSTELVVLRKHYHELQYGIQAPTVLAGRLYAEGIIDDIVRDTVQMSSTIKLEKNQALLNAVEQAISSDSQCFYQLIGILGDEPSTKPLHSMIMASYCECRVNWCIILCYE